MQARSSTPIHRSRRVVCEVLLRLHLVCDSGMAAVGSHHETRPEDTFLARRVRGPHSNHAISLSHDRDDTRSVKDFDTSRGCRGL